MNGPRPAVRIICTAALSCIPLATAAHLLDGSPDPLPRWVPIAGLIIAGVMGGIVGFAINKHRQSMERLKKRRQERAAQASADQRVTNPAPPESSP